MKPRGPVGPGERATAPNGAPFPLRSWPPDAAIDIQNLANWADPMKPETVRRYATEAARNTAIPSPADGMTCYITDIKQWQGYSAGAWRLIAGQSAIEMKRTSATAGLPVNGSDVPMNSVPYLVGPDLMNDADGSIRVERPGEYAVGMALGLGSLGQQYVAYIRHRRSGALVREYDMGGIYSPGTAIPGGSVSGSAVITGCLAGDHFWVGLYASNAGVTIAAGSFLRAQRIY